MQKIYDDVYSYSGYNGCLSRCQLQVWQAEDKLQAVVVVTELNSNPGTSITNAVEGLALEVYTQFGLSMPGTEWYEEYEHTPGKYDRAFFDLQMQPERSPNLNPKWRPTLPAELERLKSLMQEVYGG